MSRSRRLLPQNPELTKLLEEVGQPKSRRQLSLFTDDGLEALPRHRTDFLPCDPRLPPRTRVVGLQFCGLLAALEVSVWYRQDSEALTNSAVWWTPGTLHPYVVEVDFVTWNREDGRRLPVTITYPSATGPGTASFISAIRAALHRALQHEADEGLLVNGNRLFDPHAD